VSTSGRLNGKVALITGAGSGIGRAAAELFVREGAQVVCVDRSGTENDVAAGFGSSAIAVHADVAVEADWQVAIAAAERQFGKLDILFNNAGFGGPRAPLHEQTVETWDEVVDVNLKGAFLGMKYGIRSMLRSGGGSIVNTASAAGLVGFKEHGVYGAAKAGVIQLTKVAALDYATQNIRVNAICPGMTWTGLVTGSSALTAPPENAPTPPQPMKRWGLPSELAAAALFLASDEASFITGVALPVDGGYVVP
jgi:NAD(P)-dependent dehydrogenase (short-subunit alcohol dehydrogenase family)